MNLDLKKGFLILVLIMPIWTTLETVYRFVFWDTVEGEVVEVKRKGTAGLESSESLIVSFKVNGMAYTTKSSIAVSRKNLSATVAASKAPKVMYDPSDPHKSALKYKYGQLYKFLLFWTIFGIFFVLARYSFNHFRSTS